MVKSMVNIGNDWDEILKDEFTKEYYLKLRAFLKDEYAHKQIYPHMNDIFNALVYTPFKDVRVVILGQDPYHGKGQAHGLCFSVQKGITPPPSLKNIYKELQSDLHCDIPTHGELTKWAKQGVLLLNTTLTVQEGKPASHAFKGWEILTDRIISILNTKEEPVVFLLWGNHAKQKSSLINNPNHLILTSAHPSPLSAYHGFLGNRHFSQTNNFLQQHHLKSIDWQIV